MLSAEEIELLNSDPELIALRASLSAARLESAKAEAEQTEREAAFDESIDRPLAELRKSGKVYAGWCQSWQVVLNHEKQLMVSLDQLAERLLWVEEDEDSTRETIENNFDASLGELAVAEGKAIRYILESVAWAEDWLQERDKEWAAWRLAASQQKHEICFARAERKVADEGEISRLERRLAELGVVDF